VENILQLRSCAETTTTSFIAMRSYSASTPRTWTNIAAAGREMRLLGNCGAHLA
jgi:hypothetical protein